MSDTLPLSTTLPLFVKKYHGKQVEYHSFNPNAKYQCVDLVNTYIKEVLNFTPVIGTDAKDFPSKVDTSQFKVIKNTPEFIPILGDICVWNGRAGGGAGHIAIVIDNKATVNSFNSIDQNYSQPLFVTLEKHTYTNVSYFLRPLSKTISVTPTDFQVVPSKLLAFMKVKDEDEAIRVITQEKGFLDDARKEITTLTEEIKELKDRITEEAGMADARKNAIEDYSEILKCQPNIESVRESIKTAVKRESEAVEQVSKLNDLLIETNSKHKQEIDDLLNEIAEWKVKLNKQADTFEKRIEKLKQDQAQTIPLSTIITNFFKNISKLK